MVDRVALDAVRVRTQRLWNRIPRKHWYKSGLADKSGVDGSRLPEAAPEAGVAGGIRPSTLYDFGS